MLGSHEEAEDALQRVFVSAHRHLRDGTADVNLKPWLYTIARNRCVSMLRTRRETLALDDLQEPSCNGLALADEVELGEELKQMLGDIARLPDDQRAALVLAELGDLSQQEIAAALDVRPAKVKALIFQAREALAAWRQAHAASCRDVCEQLATLKGSALRRAPIRRHLAVCPSCTAFESEVKRQRVALSLVLPVIPSVALKHSVLTAALAAGPGAGAVAAGAVGAGASALTVKTVVVAALAVGAGGGGVAAVHELDRPRPAQRSAAATPARTPAATAVAAPAVSPPAGERRAGLPAAANGSSPARTPARRRGQGARGGSPAAKGRGRGRGQQQPATPAASGRQRSAERRPRPQVAEQRPVAQPRPAPAKPQRPLAEKPQAANPQPPAAARGRAPARP
jgi:RNA polymerase sigma factor (sigma-70 family)